jgi:hypothetical protein
MFLEGILRLGIMNWELDAGCSILDTCNLELGIRNLLLVTRNW